MPGIRIHHPDPTVWGTTLLIPHPGDSRTGRKPKDYHLRLNAQGDVIVSETIWNRLQEARQTGLTPHNFIVLNEVPDPPAQGLDFNPNKPPEPERYWKQIGEILREIAPPGVQPRVIRRSEYGE